MVALIEHMQREAGRLSPGGQQGNGCDVTFVLKLCCMRAITESLGISVNTEWLT